MGFAGGAIAGVHIGPARSSNGIHDGPEGAEMIRTTFPDPHIAATPRELDSRITDGIHVQLLWHPHDGHVSVAVNDTKTTDAFELIVLHGQRPLDVFHHPYAYARVPRDREPAATQRAN
jgi:hypothetical protein